MLTKFSVKKPYTVIVGVILVIILGVVAYKNMTVDLLPSMNLPYAIVMTTYGGASPEEVETTVTRPVEQSMAAISNIKDISSVSSENFSVVILEFEQTANMDSATIEMRESLDQLKGMWPSMVGNPMIMKLNPNMLPIMISAVSVEGKENADIVSTVEEKVAPELESVEGVASVSVSGAVKSHIEITLDDDKISELNDKVKAKVEETLNEAQKTLDEARAQVESGKAAMEAGVAQAAEGMSEAELQMSQGELQINQGLMEIKEKEAELNLGKTALNVVLTPKRILLEALSASKEESTELINSKDETEKALAQIERSISALERDGKTNTSEYRTLVNQRTTLNNKLDDIADAERQVGFIDEGINATNSLFSGLTDIMTQLEDGEKQLNDAKEQLQSGAMDLADARAQMASAEITAAVELAQAQVQLALGEMQLEAGQKELDANRETALKAADMTSILNKETLGMLLSAQNFNMPAGYITEEGIQYLVRVGNKFESSKDISDLVLADLTDMGADKVKVSDIAVVSTEDDSSEIYAKINGKPGILLSMQKQTEYSTGQVSDAILAKQAEISKENSDIKFVTLMDQGVYIDYVVSSVFKNMLIGAALAILVLLLFLRAWRPTVIIACAIPLSVLTAIVCMYFSKVSINIVSLAGLALGIGMLVDNAIVVIENIYRMKSMGMSSQDAAIKGAKQVAGAIIASTLTTICVFVPIVFTKGLTKQLFVDMGLTIGFSLAASLLVALTLVPMMGAGMLGKEKEVKSRFFEGFLKKYKNILAWCLDKKALVLLLALIVFVGSALLSISKGFSYMPSMESPQMTITLTTDEDSTLSETGEIADQVMARLMSIEEVQDVGAMSASESLISTSTVENKVTMYVILDEKMKLSNKEVADLIAEKTKDLDCELDISAEAMDMSQLSGSGISVDIRGRDMDKLEELATKVGEILEKTEGCEDVDNGLSDVTPEYRIIVDKTKASKYNLTVAQVYQAVSAKLADSTSMTSLSTDTGDIEIYVYDDADSQIKRSDLKDIVVNGTDAAGAAVEAKLSDIASFADANGLSSINRKAQSRYISVTAQVAEDDNVTLLSNRVQKELDKLEVPAGYSIEMAGEDATIKDAIRQLGLMLLLAILFMYLIMAAQFQSFKSPLIVMFTVPLAFTGGFLALFICGFDVSVIAMIGFIVLSGVIVNNGIVFVDYTNQLVEGGMKRKDALIEAGQTRMRPILMTAITTVLGLVSLALGLGLGADMIQPMAIVTIGGLIYGTLLTLIVVPCMYLVFNRKDRKKISADPDYRETAGTNAAPELRCQQNTAPNMEYAQQYQNGYNAPNMEYAQGYSDGYNAPGMDYTQQYQNGYNAPDMNYAQGYSDGYNAPNMDYAQGYSDGYNTPDMNYAQGQNSADEYVDRDVLDEVNSFFELDENKKISAAGEVFNFFETEKQNLNKSLKNKDKFSADEKNEDYDIFADPNIENMTLEDFVGAYDPDIEISSWSDEDKNSENFVQN